MAGLIEQSRPPAFVAIHVNSASGPVCDSIRAMLDQLAPGFPVEITSSPENLGFCRAHNTALRVGFERGASALVVLNPDLVLERDALEALAAADNGDQLLGPVLELADPETLQPTGRIDTTGIRWTSSGRHLDADQGRPVDEVAISEPRVVAGVSGACLYVPRPVHDILVAATGEFFDDDFFAYREDAELGLRAGLLGIDSVVVPAARGRHVRRLRGTARGGNFGHRPARCPQPVPVGLQVRRPSPRFASACHQPRHHRGSGRTDGRAVVTPGARRSLAASGGDAGEGCVDQRGGGSPSLGFSRERSPGAAAPIRPRARARRHRVGGARGLAGLHAAFPG